MVGPSLDDLEAVEVFQPLLDKAKVFLDSSRARSTRAAYAKEWAHFERWCEEHSTAARRLTALPAHPGTVALYLTHLATTPVRDRWGNTLDARGRRPRGIAVAVAAIAYEHTLAGRAGPHHHPDVKGILDGITRQRGLAAAQKSALLGEHLKVMVEAQPSRRLCLRNRALFLLHWAGAFRRAELVGVTVEAITFCPEGMRVRLPRSKTDQQGKGIVKAIPLGREEITCPVRALQAWLDDAAIRTGYVFLHVDRWGNLKQVLTPHAVAVLVKQWAPAAGLRHEDISGHSARAGLVTSAAKAGKRLDKIMAQTGHVKTDTVLEYIRDAEAFEGNAVDGLL
jgi:integrase